MVIFKIGQSRAKDISEILKTFSQCPKVGICL